MRRIALVLCLLAGVARADEATSKRQASALFAEGNRLLQKGDYAGALELYRGAYEKYRSPKILLNMGAALRQLGRPAEALEMYERYLADPEADAKRTAEVRAIVRELEPRAATLEVTVDQADAAVTIDGVAGPAGVRRVNPGKHTVAAAKPGFVGASQTVTVGAGARQHVGLTLAPAAVTPPLAEASPPEVVTRAASPGATRLGAMVRLDVDTRGGVAGLVGVSVRLAGVVELTAAAILGPSPGGYAGGAFMIGRGPLRPRLVAGAPILAVDGEVAPGVHVAAGLQWRPARALSVAVDFGVQHFPTLDDSAYWKTLLMPSLAVAAWF